MPPPVKTGALTLAELLDAWRGATDKSYHRPLLDAGDGNGLEVVGQTMEQLARVSRAVDATTQGLFIRPSSAQTGPPAGGARRSTVTLAFRRTLRLDQPLVLASGRLYVEEETTDWGESAGVVARTGRLYTPAADFVFLPGESGPYDVECVAQRPGVGYDNPLPGTIKHLRQEGADFTNNHAAVDSRAQAVVGGSPAAQVQVTAADQADMFVPEHVGQYVFFTAGANAGRSGRVTAFVPPSPSMLLGSGVVLSLDHAFESFAFAGTFLVGEVVTFDSGGPALGTGKVIADRDDPATGHKRVAYVMLSGVEGDNATGALSGATATVDVVLAAEVWATETTPGGTGGGTWRILGWEGDHGLSATNVLSPAGGRLGVLDELGAERALDRSPGEDDETYRARVAEIADVVTPNAIRRMLNRVLPGLPWCFREVGLGALPGFFYDGTNIPPSVTPGRAECDAYDTDVVVMTGALTSGAFEFQEPAQLEDASNNRLVGGYFGRLDAGDTVLTLIRKVNRPPASLAGLQVRGLRSGAIWTPAAYVSTPTVDALRWHVYLDYVQFRAFFLVGVPRLDDGEFGFAYDTGPWGAYDAAPYSAFYDGSAITASALYRRVYQAIDPIRAAGVTWEMYREDIGCP